MEISTEVIHMTSFPVHTIESAPERSKPALQQLQSAFGMLPNIAGAIATSPVLINSLVGLFGNVHGGSFTEPQIQTVLLTDAVVNASTWAVAFHTALALKEGIDPADVQAIREGRLPKDSKLAALSALARTMIEKRGRLDDRDVDQFIAMGFGKDHALEVIAIVPRITPAASRRRPSKRPFRHTPGPLERFTAEDSANHSRQQAVLLVNQWQIGLAKRRHVRCQKQLIPRSCLFMAR
jgi:alkylhydroperoxidase family enzyme